jgi:exopolyphosphatase / guanosine-5'-triphosphate,3'-diphosphate pyrophosphatase
MRVGVVDLGTNSTRLLVADVAGGEVAEVDRRLTITRLGEGVDGDRRLAPASVERVRRVVAGYRSSLEAHGVERAVAVATSAVRDAVNGRQFLADLEEDFGLEARLLDGNAEALLTFRGVSAGRRLETPVLVVDVGGGSTELVVGDANGVSFHASLDLGCVRETERFLTGDPPREVELDACKEHVRETLAAALPPALRPPAVLAVAGTATTLATLHLGLAKEEPELVHGHVLGTAWIDATVAGVARLRVEELGVRRGIEPERAPVLVAGGVVLLTVLRHFELPRVEVSERDILHGAALAVATGSF